jgi:three-Cys-motif partner protein
LQNVFAKISPMTDTTDEFFAEPYEHSLTKARIVSKYVQGWARILTDYQRAKGTVPQVAYVDMFSGPGSYEDGTPSTPILILKNAIDDEKLSPALMTYFNDHVRENCESLREEIRVLPKVERLRFQPSVTCERASVELLKRLSIPTSIPKLFFFDPFGYKALSALLLTEALSDWSECIVFFNYRRVIAALNNPPMQKNMVRIFGKPGLEELKSEVASASDVLKRESAVLSHLQKALKLAGAKFVLPFSFRVEDGQRSTHHLVFAGKNRKGFDLMKQIMAAESSDNRFGVANMAFTQRPKTGFLFEANPLDELALDLQQKFAGQTLSVNEIYDRHSTGNYFVPANYRTVLLKMETEGSIIAAPPTQDRPTIRQQRTLAFTTKITFPKEK